MLRALRHVVLDLDGTLYRDAELFSATRPFLETLHELGIGRSFVTNNSSRSTADQCEHLRALGIDAELEEVVTAGGSTLEILRAEHADVQRIFLIGTPSLRAEFVGAGFELCSLDDTRPPDAVVVGFDTDLDYRGLCRAAYWIQAGCAFFATHPDRVCPTSHATVMIDCGAVCQCLEAATGIAPARVFGKPDPRMITGVLQAQGLDPAQVAMVGDRLYTDMAMAKRAGVASVLVLSGEATAADVERTLEVPDLVVADVGALGAQLRGSREA